MMQRVSTLKKQERTFVLFTSGLMRKKLVGEAKPAHNIDGRIWFTGRPAITPAIRFTA
jgi:hypothetical protein